MAQLQLQLQASTTTKYTRKVVPSTSSWTINLLLFILIVLQIIKLTNSSSSTSSSSIFQILAVIPDEKHQFIARSLLRAVIEWQSQFDKKVSSTSSLSLLSVSSSSIHPSSSSSLNQFQFQPTFQRGAVQSGASFTSVPSDFRLLLSSVPVSNNSQRTIAMLCDQIEIHNPSLILSLLDRKRSFYAKMIAQSASVPFVSLTRDYVGESFFQESSSNNSMQISLDTSIVSLAKATFDLLTAQHWLDAILVVDDSAESELFSYRLSHFCQSKNNIVYKNNINNNKINGNLNGKEISKTRNHTFEPWKNLKTIHLSRGLNNQDFYLRMSEIQTSRRRVIIVHCDQMATKRIMDIAKGLGLLNGGKIWIILDSIIGSNQFSSHDLWRDLTLPEGVIALRHRPKSIRDMETLSSIVKIIGQAAVNTMKRGLNGFMRSNRTVHVPDGVPEVSCWNNISESRKRYSEALYRELKRIITPSLKAHQCKVNTNNNHEQRNNHDHHQVLYSFSNSAIENPIWPSAIFDVLNLVNVSSSSSFSSSSSKSNGSNKIWKIVGNITSDNVTINTLRFIGGPYKEHFATSSGRHRFRIVTNIAPPFVQLSTKLDNNSCLSGELCLQVNTSERQDLISIFTDFRTERKDEGLKYNVQCCAGIAIDLLNSIAKDLQFDYDLYLVADGLFGIKRNGQWDGVTADLVNDVAHMTFTAFSTTSTRVQAIDYSVPFFYSGVSCLSYSNYSDVPLSAFLIPFSMELWVAIFASLIVTSCVSAIYEWLSPFGLNPWGRQRTKNFSMGSSLWVMTSLLFSHLIAFKAPKSWPNKVLINLWGCFSVIFLATYTANIAAHFAGLFLIPEVNDFHDTSLMKQKTGTARSSASEGYLLEKYTEMWQHIQKYRVNSFTEGLEYLRDHKLEVLIGDTAILDYFRATDPGCGLRLLGDSIFDDAYAVGMQRGFPLKEAISNLILKYNEYGLLDQLQRKWYGRVSCFENAGVKPKPLGIRAVAGVFMMLGFGMIIGCMILGLEHVAFKYYLPSLRKKPKDSFWRSLNLMLFSQKLYRFINTVELVSPHHSAKEIMSNLREGQITSLFQKSVKRKAKEEARRRKSKSQFFEMIQEVRKVVQLHQQERSLQDDSIEISMITPIPSTVPSFKQDSIMSQESSENGSTQLRTPSIRFKEPGDSFDDDHYRVPREPLPPNQIVNPPSSLKGSKKGLKSGKKKTEKDLNLTSAASSSSEVGIGIATGFNQKKDAKSLSRSKFVPQQTSTISISLENIQSSSSSSPVRHEMKIVTNGHRKLEKSLSDPRKAKTWSFDDLDVLKKQLNEENVTPSDRDHSSTMLYDFGLAPLAPPKKTVMLSSPRHLTIFDDLKLSSLTKDDIISMWRSSERELLNQLQDAFQQKRALEEKVALLQRMLMKPP